MTKRAILLVFVIFTTAVLPILVLHASQSELQRDTGINLFLSQQIESILDNHNIKTKSIEPNKNESLIYTTKLISTFALDTGAGDVYTLVLSNNKDSFIAILDDESKLVEGVLDNSIVRDMSKL